MGEIIYRDRSTKQLKKEKIYGKFFIEILYGNSLLSKLFSFFVVPLIAHAPSFSFFYGKNQKSKKSRTKIIPFIRDFHINVAEFADPVESFYSFNDFFIRKLKPEARPIVSGENIAVFPADGRHFVFPDISQIEGFYIKDSKFDLCRLLNDEFLFELYKRGAMVISRLCPTDYHRFHFPCTSIPGKAKLINGPLFSVNPLALKKHIAILSENKRVLTSLETGLFGQLLYIEVGAICVGSIKQTFITNKTHEKGEEKGYFEFGGSCIILLFQPDTIQFDQDLIDASAGYIETYAKMGTSLGKAIASPP
ncbi:MAG: archaetidylserine decarboxylase [Candidatus Neptunochlamydia sp.]|nr:archaetidylserine decarboxylase [Candidatus Neptunochlamydia sp.]